MRSSAILSAVMATLAAAAPASLAKRDDIDFTILNFALTLEHLEATFYARGLAKFSKADFDKAGFKDPNFYANLRKVAADEATHVTVIEKVLAQANQPAAAACQYDFGLTTPKAFVALASVLEGVGVTAYLGAAASITSKDYLTAAGSILTVEARHNAFIRNSQYQSPFPAAFDTPLDVNQVYTLASPFIKSCPSGNPDLGAKAFPALTNKAKGFVKSDSQITFGLPKDFKKTSDKLYIAWPTVVGTIFKDATYDSAKNTVTSQVPDQSVAGPAGQAYAILTSDNTALADNTTLAGPSVVMITVKKY